MSANDQCKRCGKYAPADIHTSSTMEYIVELETALRDALGSAKCTQRVADYPKSHWTRRACALLNEPVEQPGYIAFTR